MKMPVCFLYKQINPEFYMQSKSKREQRGIKDTKGRGKVTEIKM